MALMLSKKKSAGGGLVPLKDTVAYDNRGTHGVTNIVSGQQISYSCDQGAFSCIINCTGYDTITFANQNLEASGFEAVKSDGTMVGINTGAPFSLTDVELIYCWTNNVGTVKVVAFTLS